MRAPLTAVVIGLGLVACQATAPEGPPPLPEGCQPLMDGRDCLLPFPSDFFLVDDASLPSGRRVAVDGAARLRTLEGVEAVPYLDRVADGASRLASIGFLLGGPIDEAQLPAVRGDPSASMAADSPTRILDATTGAAIPHYADVDPEAEDPADRLIALHPVRPLEPERRYVVVVRGLSGPDGGLAPTPAGFLRLRDGLEDPRLEAERRRYDRDVWPVLAQAGVPRSEVQLAWSFTTGSRALAERDLLAVRAQTLEALAAGPPVVRVERVERFDTGTTARRIEGVLEVPSFLDDPEPGGRLVYDPAGRVRRTGTVEVQFLAIVPRRALSSTTAARVIGWGHGFFGDRRELDGGSPVEIAHRLGAVLVAVNWWGMSTPDLFLVVDGVVSRQAEALRFNERVHQAFANWLVMFAAVRGPLLDDDAFRREDGTPLVDPARIGFLGVSLGHVLGGTLAALAPDVDRFALHVGGAGFSQMLRRARPFQAFVSFMESALPAALDRQKYMLMMQETLDRIDPGTWAEHVLDDPLPGSRERRVLMQTGLGDAQVPNVASFFHARALGLPLVLPSPAQPWGLETRAAPSESGLTLYDFGVDLSRYDPATPRAPANPVHDEVRRNAAAIRQLDAFFRPDGAVIAPCDGPCDPD